MKIDLRIFLAITFAPYLAGYTARPVSSADLWRVVTHSGPVE